MQILRFDPATQGTARRNAGVPHEIAVFIWTEDCLKAVNRGNKILRASAHV
jgi:hypothetical protein